MATFEYRKLFRAEIVLKVAYKSVSTPQKKGMAFSKNISSTGINVILADKIDKGTQLELEIYISENDKPLLARAQVIWQTDCAYIPASKKQYYSTGMQLVYMSNQDAIKTSDFVRNALREHSEVNNKKIIEKIESLENT